MTILIVDDHPTNLKLLRAQSDVLMPSMDGYQLCHAMRKNERFNGIPCILYSNTFASDSSREMALGFGADLFLKKPAPVNAILAAFNEVSSSVRRSVAADNPVQHLKETQPYSAHLIHELERQNQELEETKIKLLEINHKFLTRTKQLEEVEAQLRTTNADLEHRVRVRTADLELANKELESFSYSVSHDLRAPLRAISGFSQSVLHRADHQLEKASRDDLLRVVAAAGQMAELIDALLVLSKATRAEIRRQPVNLSAMAQMVLDELARAQPDGSTEIIVQPNITVEADARLLRIVMTNLLGNAWKFTRKTAQPRIEFGADESDDQCAYFVRDNGAGFDIKYAHKLFGAFQRLHSMAEFEGTGIGLATVHRIITRHGGKTWAEGVPQQGATFHFTLAE